MNHVFVWTLNDVLGVVALGLFLVVVGGVFVVTWINDATHRIFRNRK